MDEYIIQRDIGTLIKSAIGNEILMRPDFIDMFVSPTQLEASIFVYIVKYRRDLFAQIFDAMMFYHNKEMIVAISQCSEAEIMEISHGSLAFLQCEMEIMFELDLETFKKMRKYMGLSIVPNIPQKYFRYIIDLNESQQTCLCEFKDLLNNMSLNNDDIIDYCKSPGIMYNANFVRMTLTQYLATINAIKERADLLWRLGELPN